MNATTRIITACVVSAATVVRPTRHMHRAPIDSRSAACLTEQEQR